MKSASSPRLLSRAYPLGWFALAAFLVFGMTIRYDYTWLDDQTLVLNNLPNLKSSAYVTHAFTGDVFNSLPGNRYYYRPVLTLSFMADAMAGGGSFAAFHVSNILLHIVAAYLLFLWLVAMGFNRMRSFLFSLLFLLHPLTTQAVAWVPGRNDSLLAIFILASFVGWIRHLDTGRPGWLVVHLVVYLLALFTKENAVVAPVFFLLYGTMIRGRTAKKLALPGLAWLVLTLGWALIRHEALGSSGGASLAVQGLSVLRGLPALLPFLGKAFFPFHLSVFPILADMKVSMMLGVVALVILAALVRFTRPDQRWVSLFGLLWFIAFLAPSFVSVSGQIPNYSEHRSYLSLAGMLLMVMASAPLTGNTLTRPALLTVAGMILLFGALTMHHARHFRDRFAFWHNAVETSPSHAFNYNNLGAMYFLAGQMEQAEPFFRKALEINPREPMAHGNAGLICMNTGRRDEAEQLYLEEIRINPRYDHAYFNLGLLYFNGGRQEEGIRQWEKTLEINPRYRDAYDALMFAYGKLNRPRDSTRILRKAEEQGVYVK